MPGQMNNFVIPTPDGQLVLHVSPGPCHHHEHWLDPLQFGFRDSLRHHIAIHALIGLFCILIQISSKYPDLVWYGRLGVGTWAGLLFLATCLVGSYASNADLPPRPMRSWLVAYSACCTLSAGGASTLSLLNAIRAPHLYLSAWQHAVLALLGAVETFFCVIQVALVLYRLCTAPGVPQGWDLHLLVEYASDADGLARAPAVPLGEVPPPSYDQVYRETGMEMVRVPGASVQPPVEAATPSQSGEMTPSRTRLTGTEPLPLAVLRRWDVLQTLFGRRGAVASAS